MSKSTGDGLTITPCHVYAQSMYHCILCISYRIINHNRNRVLLYYFFLENKSFSSKKPFAFILWCTGSCVKHSNIWARVTFCLGKHMDKGNDGQGSFWTRTMLRPRESQKTVHNRTCAIIGHGRTRIHPWNYQGSWKIIPNLLLYFQAAILVGAFWTPSSFKLHQYLYIYI